MRWLVRPQRCWAGFDAEHAENIAKASSRAVIAIGMCTGREQTGTVRLFPAVALRQAYGANQTTERLPLSVTGSIPTFRAETHGGALGDVQTTKQVSGAAVELD